MGALCALLACCASGCGAALAQGTAAPADVLASVLPDYPPGSIDSTARADAALARVNEARAAQEARYAQARKLCFDKFLAEQCLSEARLDNFRVTSRIRDVEREARAVTRSEELRERDQARDARNREAQAAAERKRADSARKQAERDERAAARLGKDGPEEAARRAARAQEANQRAASRAEARERKDAEARAGAAERAERARKHDEMVREALERAERRARAEEKKAAERRAAAAQAPTGR
jgi:hypothetical protein